MPELRYRIADTIFDTEDYIVTAFVATEPPYGLDGSGKADVTEGLQKLLDDCHAAGGGTVFLPAGRYRLTGGIVVPHHVTLRGDYNPSDAPGGDFGTVIVADVGPSESELPGLVRLLGSAGVQGLTFYYPAQSLEDVRPYPYTLEIPGTAGGPNAWMAQTIRDVTLLNSYRGIAASLTDPSDRGAHEVHYLVGIKGSPLHTGMRIQNCSDTGRTRDISFGSGFWSDAGGAFGAPEREALREYMMSHTLGVAFGDSEWETLISVAVSDCETGFLITHGPRIGALMECHGVRVTGCLHPLVIENVDPRCGVMFADSLFAAADRPGSAALTITEKLWGSSLYNNCAFDAPSGAPVRLLGEHYANFQNCRFGRCASEYAITAERGALIAEGCEFAGPAKPIWAGEYCAGVVVGAVKCDGGDIVSGGCRKVALSPGGWESYPRKSVSHKRYGGKLKPAARTLYVVVGAGGDSSDKDSLADASSSIQRALDETGAAGGGIVYLPSGHYRLDSPVTVPEGVELRGSEGVPHRGDAIGTSLWITHGHGTPTPDSDSASVTLKSRAGLRGLSFYYPDYPRWPEAQSQDDYVAYPWAIRGDGEDVYVVDVTNINTWRVLDLSGEHSARCERHFVRYLAGTALHDGVRVSRCSEGWLEDCNFNPNCWARTDLPNRFACRHYEGEMKYLQEHLTMLALGSCGCEHVLNFALYGADIAYRMYADSGEGPVATLINTPADGTSGNILVEATGEDGVTVTNTVLCVLAASNARNDGVAVQGGKIFVRNIQALGFNDGNALEDDTNIRLSGGDAVVEGACFWFRTLRAKSGRGFLSGMIFKYPLEEGAIADPAEVTLTGDIHGLINRR